KISFFSLQEGHLFTPLIYAFLSTKTTRSYELEYEWLAQNGVAAPLTMTCDFERGIFSAFSSVYPTTTVTRCWFHWLKNIYCKIQVSDFEFGNSHWKMNHVNKQELKMSKLYANPATKKFFKAFMALSLIPLPDLIDYYDEWKDEFTNSLPYIHTANIDKFVDYVEDTYVDRILPGGNRRQLMYPAAVWSVHDRIIAGMQLGNSTVESYNSKMKIFFFYRFSPIMNIQEITPKSTSSKVAVDLLKHQMKYRARRRKRAEIS
ncbi:hypothetical protein PFISCL1PPCAC_14117, partial [Pristionchus fissidentatus]